jgi:predicted HAD superfamily hydrolase
VENNRPDTTLQSFYTWQSLIQQANSQLDQFDTISFDVFDTLFIRRVPDPNMIKIPVAKMISDAAKKSDIQISPREVQLLRNTIEQTHRDINGATYPDFEARYDDYMQEVLLSIFGKKLPSSLFKQVANFEIAMESAMIVVREEAVDWIKALHLKGIRLFLVSDIYLPAKYLKTLAKDKHIAQYFEDIISSADTFNAKASGAAWPLLQTKHDLNKDKWLHIGDNAHSDFIKPIEFGISAYHLHDIGEHHRLSLATRYNYYATKRDFWKGRNHLQWMLPLEQENQDKSPLYTDGFGFFGYLLSYFIHKLIERCKEEDIERVYFCAREGWLFKQIWDAMVPWFYPLGDAPKASYLYVSRMGVASTACAHQGLSVLNSHVARFPAGNRDFKDICRIFKLDVEQFTGHLDRFGLNDDDAIGFNSADYNEAADGKFAHLLDDQAFQTEVKRQTKDSNSAFQLYLESEGFFESDKVALVDIGWLGTIQHYLSDAIEPRTDKPRIFGFTLGAIRAAPYRNTHQNSLEGLVYDAHRVSFYSSMTNTLKPVLEEICRAPHPTLIAYKVEAGKPKLVFRKTDDAIGQDEIAQSQYYAPLHEGVVENAKRYAAAAQIYNYKTGNLKAWLNFMYLAKVAFPKTAEIIRVRHEAHQDDFAGQHQGSTKSIKDDSSLWTASKSKLRFNPFTRLAWFINNAYRFLSH